MRVLLLGGGGREHAIGWKLAQSEMLGELISAPGNPGLAMLGPVVTGIDITDPAAVTDLALANDIDLVVVGPEAPLAAGIVDALGAADVAAFGPTRAAARLESSKRFAKEVMRRADVPTARGESFIDLPSIASHLESIRGPYVVKADGLAAGKGVLVTDDLAAAHEWARRCIEGKFGDAGTTVVVEEHLSGQEVSILAICDGTRVLPLEPARDYKRLSDGDAGPNTGGMGCYSPVDDLPADLVAWTAAEVMTPVLDTLRADGIVYRGFLYAGLILTADGPKVLEFNCRLGDPETQVMLPRLEGDLLALMTGRLPDDGLSWSDLAAVDVVLAAAGYPDAPEWGAPISGLEAFTSRSDVLAFHAGTKTVADGIVASGGRVLNVVGLGNTVTEARRVAYDAVEKIEFAGMIYRSDIAGSAR